MRPRSAQEDFKRNFQLYKNSRGEMSRLKGEDAKEPRQIKLFEKTPRDSPSTPLR
jgi:hypothetical protein